MTRWAKAGQWARLFSEYAVAQGLVQLLGVAAGLWLVHLLSVREYALYTLALSILAFLSVFSDLGISSALSFFRRETRIRRTAFAPYVRAAFALRRGLLALGAVAGSGFMLTVGRNRGFGAVELLAIAPVLIAAVWVQIDASIALLLLRLEGRYRESYLAEVLGNASRLAGVAAMWAATAPLAWLALSTSAVGSFITRLMGMRSVLALPQADSDETQATRGAVVGIVRNVLPMSLSAMYFSIQAPLTVWLAAYFAGTDSIAEVGALGRLGMLFSLVSGFVGTILVPRLAAVTDERHYLRRYLQCWMVLVAFGGAVLGLAWLAPDLLLLLIGNNYKDLAGGVVIVAASSVLSAWGGFAIAVNNARGWVRLQPLALGIYALLQVWLIASLDLSTTIGVLCFGLYSSLAGLALHAAINALGFVMASGRTER